MYLVERMERVATFRFPESSLRSSRAREENSGTVRQGWGFKSKRGDSQCRFVTVTSACDIPLLAGSLGETVHKKDVTG
jgi:hypothetical protein